MQEMEGLNSLGLLSQDVLDSQHIRTNLKSLFINRCMQFAEPVAEGEHRLPLDHLMLKDPSRLKEIIWKGVKPRDILPLLLCVHIY